MTSEKVSKLLDDIQLLHPTFYTLVVAVREIIFDLDPLVTEEVKYGGILFSKGTAFGGIFCYAKHVSMEFSSGATLADDYQQLQGSGKFRRHIKLRTCDDIHSTHLTEYISLALAQATDHR
ncbi:uncharacterized protein DUF1801 [Acinetobacter calcoaceticus]|uniref:Uncharacterized protein DUF1801 n=1 Tax=Acinetobacter calcoaceticus TaxID=471 RepID=A0A4V2QZN2_ACICA|nr:uncharacterized protein DUF1801 [Acinetobacter calcoaceticus]